MYDLNDVNYVSNIYYTQTAMTQTDSESSTIYEATVKEKIFLDDPGYGNVEMIYKLDNGISILFRRYCDPGFRVGQKISWTKDWNGIYVSLGDHSVYIPGDPNGTWFERT